MFNSKYENITLLTLILFAGNCFLYATRAIVALAINDICNDFGWDRFQSALVMSAFFCGYSITQVFAGFIADYYGGHRVIQITTIGWATLTLILPIMIRWLKSEVNPLYLVIGIRLLTGCFQGFFYPSLSAISSREFGINRSITYSRIISGAYFGTVLCGGFGSYLMSVLGWGSAFIVFGLASLAWNGVYWYTCADSKLQHPKLHLPSPSTKRKHTPFYSIIIWKSAFWALIFAYLCQSVAFSILFSWLPTFFKDRHPTAKQWLVNVIPWSICVPVTSLGGSMCDALKSRAYTLTKIRKTAVFVSLVCTGLCLLILSIFSYSLSISVSILMIAMSCYCINTVGLMINPQDICPDNAGTVFGFMNMIGTIPGFTSVLVVGSFLQNSNNDWNTVFRTTSIVCFTGFTVYFGFGTAKPIV